MCLLIGDGRLEVQGVQELELQMNDVQIEEEVRKCPSHQYCCCFVLVEGCCDEAQDSSAAYSVVSHADEVGGTQAVPAEG